MEAVYRRLQIFLALFLPVATIGTAGFMHPENLSFAEAFYYNIVTMSTVGYGDMNRTYGMLAEQWLFYLQHLKSQYPYLFSL